MRIKPLFHSITQTNSFALLCDSTDMCPIIEKLSGIINSWLLIVVHLTLANQLTDSTLMFIVLPIFLKDFLGKCNSSTVLLLYLSRHNEVKTLSYQKCYSLAMEAGSPCVEFSP